jgi:hypothetical protein
MRGGGRVCVFLLCFWAAAAFAELPDANTFSWTVERGSVEHVRAWLDEGLDPEFQGGQFGTGLMTAAWYGRIDMMALFLERGANPRRANRNGEQPLQLAAWNGHTEAVKWLLDHGAVLNREGNQWGALHYAVFNGHHELARYLIERGASVNAPSPNGSTPLMLAAREGREELVRTLIDAGADPHARNDWGDTALIMAMRYDRFQIGKMISTSEEFAQAVKAPKETFGVATRSASAPSEVENLMNRIREAEASGAPSDELHRQLKEAVSALRRSWNGSTVVRNNVKPSMPLPYAPRTLVITGNRRQPGAERAQIVVGNGKPAADKAARTGKAGGAASEAAAPPASISITPASQRATQAQIAETMRQIRLAEAQGRPAEALRRQLAELVETLQ